MSVQIQGDTGNVIATKGTYSGNVTIGGTLTYEVVTNIDAVGLITARNGIEIGARPGVAASISVDGDAIFSGITTVGGRIDTTDTTDGALNATFARGQDTNFQLQFRNHRHSNTAVSGVGSFGVFYADNDIVGLSFMRGIGSSGAGSLGVTQAGVEKVRVYYNGHVGIGSTQPVKQFVVNTAAGTNGGILVQPAAAYANNTNRAYLIAGTDGWTGATTNWNTYGFQHRIKSTESGIGRVTIDTQAGEAFSVDNSGNVGIGTVTQLGKLAIGKATGTYLNNHGLIVNRPHSIGLKNGVLVYTDTGYNPTVSYRACAFKAVGTTGNALGISTDAGSNGLGGTLTARIDFDGKAHFMGDVGIGEQSPTCPLQITSGSSGDGTITFLELNHGGNNTNDAVKLNFARAGSDIGSIVLEKVADNNNTDIIINARVGNTIYEAMRIAGDNGGLGINVTDPAEKLHVAGNGRFNKLLVNTDAFHNSGKFELKGHSTGSHTAMRAQDSSGTEIMKLRCDGYFAVSGALVKGSGSFKIDHPLPSLASTKILRHSFIEGPQCDNIYRGKVTLSSGTTTINLDTKSGMTEGTFVALNRDVQCFTTNETGWTNVKGSVTGNQLTIIAQDNTCTDTISWMVIGERQDPNIKTSAITDDDGYLIVEEDKVDSLE